MEAVQDFEPVALTALPVDKATAVQVLTDHGQVLMSQLAVTSNAMLDRIEGGLKQQRRLIVDASHELRTPFAVMRTGSDVNLRGDEYPVRLGGAGQPAGGIDRMSRTVANLLTLAAVDDGELELLTVPVDLHQAIEEAAASLQTLTAAKFDLLEITGDRREALADPQRIQLVCKNLVETPSNCVHPWRRPRLELEPTWLGRHHGARQRAGISEPHREHLFDRFYRVGCGAGGGLEWR